MNNIRLLLALSIGLYCVTFVPFAVYADGPLPEDVSTFIAKRDICDHFRGEEPYDSERLAYINKMTQQSCIGTDKTLAGLRKKYKNTPNIVKKLSVYEDTIESSPQ